MKGKKTRNKAKLKIYLADLDHFFVGSRIAVPLNVASIASYCKSLYGDELDIVLFKHPDELIREIRHSPPHILGLSYYMWNANLSLRVIEYCKKISPDIVTVIGGASVARITDRYRSLLERNRSLDIVVLDYGEKSFANILHTVLSRGFNKEAIFGKAIAGCAIRIKNESPIIRANTTYDSGYVKDIPSVYLNGYMDKFLNTGLIPQVETTRGCPYHCTYCECGDKFFSKLAIRNEGVIREELLYLLKHSKTKELIVPDSNFGILGERDLRLSSFMLQLYRKHGFPIVTDISSAKVKTRVCIEVMKNMAYFRGIFYLGLQTLTKDVLDNCRRKNISDETISELVAIAKENNHSVCTDLIFGLPGETAQSFMDTISKAVSLGIAMPAVYQLRLLPGTIIAEKERDKYGYKTRFRPFNNRFGEYTFIIGQKPTRIIEVEEIAYECNTFNKDDYMAIREHTFMALLLLTYGAFTKSIMYLSSKGINITEIIKAVQQESKRYPVLSALFRDFRLYSEKELFKSEEDLYKNIIEDDKEWNDLLLNKGNYFKINLGFIGYCLFENIVILKNIEQIIREYIMARSRLSADEMEDLEQVFKKDRLCWVIQNKEEGKLKPADIQKEVYVKEEFDYKQWETDGFKGRLSDHKLSCPVDAVYYIEEYEDLKQKVEEYTAFSGYNFYERILQNALKLSLKRVCKPTVKDCGCIVKQL